MYIAPLLIHMKRKSSAVSLQFANVAAKKEKVCISRSMCRRVIFQVRNRNCGEMYVVDVVEFSQNGVLIVAKVDDVIDGIMIGLVIVRVVMDTEGVEVV